MQSANWCRDKKLAANLHWKHREFH